MKIFASFLVGTLLAASAVVAASNPVVGGSEMFPTKNIVQNAMNSQDHTTLVAAVKAAGLVDTLQSPGPFTVFAPTNEAFAKLPAGTAGKMGTKELAQAIKAGNGTAHLKTVSGGMLTATMKGKDLLVMDEKGGTAKVTITNVNQSNGVIHVVDSVLLPN